MSLFRIQSVDQESFFTRLDFLTKLCLIVIVSILAFLWEDPIYQIILALLVLIANIVLGVKKDYLVKFLLIILPFYIFLLLTHAFFNRDQIMTLLGTKQLSPIFTFPEKWWLVGGIYPTWEGLWYGINILFKTLSLTLVIPLAVFTTDPNKMMVSLLRIKIPYKIIFIFSSTLRFFPLLIDEFNLIVEAQKLRGIALEKMGVFKRVKTYASVGVPLILGALAKSQQMEVVLQSKAFSGSSDRTYLYETRITTPDIVIIAICSIILILAIITRIRFQWGIFRIPF